MASVHRRFLPGASSVVKLLLAVTPLLAGASGSSGSSAIPSRDPQPAKWTLPSPSSQEAEWRHLDKNKFLKVVGDFNGDGIEDTALLRESPVRKEAALFVYASNNAGGRTTYKIQGKAGLGSIEDTGVSKVSPGRQATACGKGYWNCAVGEPAVLLLRFDAIELFKYESRSSYVYWDAHSRTFKAVMVSD